MQLVGLREIERKIRQLERKLKKQSALQALRKGAEISLVRAKALVPNTSGEGTGTMASKLMVRNMTGLKKGRVGVMVGFRKSAKLIHVTKAGERYFIPFSVEYGHAAPGVTAGLIIAAGGKRSHRKGFAPKHTPPHPFMRPALDATKGQAERAIKSDFAASALKGWVS